MEADGLFALEGIHMVGAEQSMVEIREALEYYCINFLRPWLEEYFYQKVLKFSTIAFSLASESQGPRTRRLG